MAQPLPMILKINYADPNLLLQSPYVMPKNTVPYKRTCQHVRGSQTDPHWPLAFLGRDTFTQPLPLLKNSLQLCSRNGDCLVAGCIS